MMELSAVHAIFRETLHWLLIALNRSTPPTIINQSTNLPVLVQWVPPHDTGRSHQGEGFQFKTRSLLRYPSLYLSNLVHCLILYLHPPVYHHLSGHQGRQSPFLRTLVDEQVMTTVYAPCKY